MNTTKILGEAVAIQNQGIIDRTETQGTDGLTSAIIVGRFIRGRTDKPMTIHQGNIRGQLGYDPNNLDYQAVQDCLDTGVPSVQVLRVGNISSSPSCIAVGFDLGLFSSYPLKPNVELYIDYKINNDAIQRWTYTPFNSDPEVHYLNVFSEFLNYLVETGYIVGGGGGSGYFQKMGYGSVNAVSLNEAIFQSSMNITFYAVAGQTNDVIQTLFDQSEVNIHSCGTKNFEGY